MKNNRTIQEAPFFYRIVFTCLLAMALFLCALSAGRKGLPIPKEGDLTIEITGLRNDEGFVLLSMFCSEDGFPTHAEKSCRKGKEKSAAGKARFVYKNLGAGTYAVAVLHDENGNMKMDTKFLGLPKEGYGFSQNPKLRFGPPSFESASFVHDGNQTVTISMKY